MTPKKDLPFGAGRTLRLRFLALAAAAAVSFSGCAIVRVSPLPAGRVLFEAVDPLQKVFRETAFFPEADPRADVARGEQASFQFVVRATGRVQDLKAEASEFRSVDGARLGRPEIGYVGYVHIGRVDETPSHDRLYSLAGYYPDPILERPPADIPPETSQAVWVGVPVPRDAAPGVYRGSVTVSGAYEGYPFRQTKTCTIQVYPPVIEKTRLWVTNWFNASPDNLALLTGGSKVEPFSDLYWDLIRVLARKMAAYRQNVALISPLRLAAYALEDGRYTIDFSRFDRMVRVFIEEGVIGLIEGGHIGGRAGEWESPFIVYVPETTGPGGEGGEAEFRPYPISDEKARNFYSQFFPALVAHLAEEGWSDIYLQHLADEPTKDNFESYIEIAQFVRQYAPDLKFIEACHTTELAGMLGVWVPQLDYFNTDNAFYQDVAAKGGEVWFYTSTGGSISGRPTPSARRPGSKPSRGSSSRPATRGLPTRPSTGSSARSASRPCATGSWTTSCSVASRPSGRRRPGSSPAKWSTASRPTTSTSRPSARNGERSSRC
jgi:hypothetical protein